MEKAKILSVLSIVYVSLLIPSAFAQGDMIEDFVEGGVETLVDDFTENLDFSDPNMLNATEHETEALKDSGLGFLGALIEMIKASHHLSEDLINFLSPYPVPQFIVTMVAIAITVIIALGIVKRIAFHIVLLSVIVLLIVGLMVYFFY